MCYMSEDGHRARIGVREMRQNLSVYLERVKAGESLDVTEHNRVVARLVPPEPADLIEQMLSDGRLTDARGRLQDLPPPPKASAGSPTLTEILVQMRNEERW